MNPTDVHILNVGAGSCTVIRSPSGRTTMVDLNDGGRLRSYEQEQIRDEFGLLEAVLKQLAAQRDLVDPINWYQEHVGTWLHRFILSHPDRDHMSGVRRILQGELDVTNFWDIPHHRTRTQADFGSDAAWNDWRWYNAFRRARVVPGLAWPKRLSPLRGAAGDYWTDDAIEILSPTPKLVAEGDAAAVYNNASYVLGISHGPTSRLLLASDVETKAWFDMIVAKRHLKANVLIASHHGRKSGYSELAMRFIRPEVVIVSTGKLPPKDDGILLYRKHTDAVFSTREHGTISVRMFDAGLIEVRAADGTLLERLVDRVTV